MSKKVAVLAVNPVNGYGLFNYLENFFENGIAYTTFAVAESTAISTNSGIAFQTDDVVANLLNRVDEFDALVFACGDAMPKFAENAGKPYNQAMLQAMSAFSSKGKLMIGHCVGGFLFDGLTEAKGKTIALHPYAKPALKNAIGSDANFAVDGIFYTAETEKSLAALMPKVLEALK